MNNTCKLMDILAETVNKIFASRTKQHIKINAVFQE